MALIRKLLQTFWRQRTLVSVSEKVNYRNIKPLAYLRTAAQQHNYLWLSPLPIFAFTLALTTNKKEEARLYQKLFAASKDKLSDINEALSSGVDLNKRHLLGWTALHVAVINRNHRAVVALLEAGVDVDAGDEYSNYYDVATKKKLNPLQVLTTRETEFTDVLSTRTSFSNFTALHYAALLGDQFIIGALLDAGADASIENDSGHTASAYCHGDECRELLLQHEKLCQERRAQREAEERRRFPLEERIRQRIIGQEAAICAVAAAIRRKENGWYDEDHPLVMLFLGSSGIGKTELAKQVAYYLHKKEKNSFIRFDMSEFQSKHEVSKFIGSPPGYVGHQEGGQLTKQLAESPTAVVLFDEIEKAHTDILTVLLQLFDEGRLTDGQGKTIECKGATFIMTSNLASEQIAEHASQLRRSIERGGKKGADVVEDRIEISKKFKEIIIKPILKEHFKRDEFLGRINEVIYFFPFSRSELSKLVTTEMQAWAERALKKHHIELTWDHNVVDVLADGYDVNYGARSIKHEVEKQVISKLALAHERQLIGEGSCVRLIAYLHSKQLDITKGKSGGGKGGNDGEEGSGGERVKSAGTPVIKLQVRKKGGKHYEDVKLEEVVNVLH